MTEKHDARDNIVGDTNPDGVAQEFEHPLTDDTLEAIYKAEVEGLTVEELSEVERKSNRV